MVGGTEASIEALPWQVAVLASFEFEGEKFHLLCGGAIVDTTRMVTAGHCAFNFFTGQRLSAASFEVVAGVSALTEKEIKEGPTSQVRSVSAVRVHPYFGYEAELPAPDDIAVLQLQLPLNASSGVKTIGLPATTLAPPEGSGISLSGYGQQNPGAEPNGKLYSLGSSVAFSRRCGGEFDAVFVCGSSLGGSACSGDSGGPVVAGSPPTLVGIVDIVAIGCPPGAINGFVNLAAPEVRDFIEGSETPPLAPRGGGAVIKGLTIAGHALSCLPGSWSHSPAFTYAFIDSASGQVLQRGPSSTYLLSGADIGRAILCLVQASNAGGTGIARTGALAPVTPAPAPLPAAGVGGVLGSTTASISAAQIAALLKQQLTPTGKAAKIAALLKTGGLTVKLRALEPGTAVINWYQLPPGAKRSNAKARPVLAASGQVTFSAAGTMKLKIKLTATGRRLLKRSKRLKLTAKGTFTPLGQPVVTATKTFVLKR